MMKSLARYNIGKLARVAGVPATTVRYYERIGLLTPAGRTMSNYRFYDDQSLARLRFIRLAHTGGLSLSDIKTILSLAEDSRSGTHCRKVSHLIERRLTAVRSQIQELQRLEKILAEDLKLCRSQSQRCAVVEQLQNASRGLKGCSDA